MKWRERLGVWIMIHGQFALATVCRWIMGGITNDAIRALIESAKPHMETFTGRNGMARSQTQLQDMLAKLSSRIPSDLTWRFHEEQIAGCRAMILPRTMDSNTAVVLASENPQYQSGDIITTDGHPPNCDQAALNFILNGPTQEQPQA